MLTKRNPQQLQRWYFIMWLLFFIPPVLFVAKELSLLWGGPDFFVEIFRTLQGTAYELPVTVFVVWISPTIMIYCATNFIRNGGQRWLGLVLAAAGPLLTILALILISS